MTEPTDAEIFVVAREAGLLPDNSHPAPETRAARKHSNAVQAFARAVLTKWGTPQPAQPQAGAVPLKDEQIDALDLPPSGTATVRDLVRIIEAAHGIGIKGGQHGAE